MADAYTIRRLGAAEARDAVPALSDILIDCVEGGASVGFLAPLAPDRAAAFWRKVAEAVARGERALLVAEDRSGDIVGCVQILLDQPENQPHRGDIAKLLVHRRARRQGLGAALMRAAEQAARAAGKTLLVLDTATGSEAERLYPRLGWALAGRIPGYCLMPDGQPCGTTIFYKPLPALNEDWTSAAPGPIFRVHDP